MTATKGFFSLIQFCPDLARRVRQRWPGAGGA
jgi:hypothetical protein